MHRRTLAVLLAAGTLASQSATAQCTKPGVSRWTGKTSLPTKRNEPIPVTLEDLTALGVPADPPLNKELATSSPAHFGTLLKHVPIGRSSSGTLLSPTHPAPHT